VLIARQSWRREQNSATNVERRSSLLANGQEDVKRGFEQRSPLGARRQNGVGPFVSIVRVGQIQNLVNFWLIMIDK
jgi:hypothetical protein